MSGYDYEFVITFSNGQVRKTTYQHLVSLLGLSNEIMHGAKMSEGGTPQAFSLKQMLVETPELKGATIDIYFNGSLIG